MKKEKGAVVLYVTVVCLFLLIIGITAYIGVSNKQAAQIAQLKQIEQSYQTTELQEEELYKQYEGGDIVPVYTPQQFEKVGSGEEVYVAEEGKIYTYSTDKTYMFYGIAEDLTETLRDQIREEIKTQIGEGDIITPEKRQEPCAPVLGDNMVAVYWSKDNGQTASVNEEGATPIYSKIDSSGNPSSNGSVNPNFKEENWYEYVAGYNLVDGKTSRWANAVTDDGSYWVWIPRYKYKITNQPTSAGIENAGKIDVEFIPTTDKMGAEGYTTGANADGEILTTDSEGYIIHPAFENGSSTGKNNGFENGEWDSELPGFWIAKYEMSMEDGEGNALNTDEVEGNVAISAEVKMVSKPNVSSWREIQIGQIYQNCIKYDTGKNSHMIKNSEWRSSGILNP